MITEFEFTAANMEMALLFLILPLIVLLHFYFLRHSKKRALKFGNFSAMKRVSGKTIISKNLTPLVFLLLVFSLMILSLMQVSLWLMEDISDVDYYVLLDSGASMNARDLYPDRYEIAKRLAKEITNNLTGAQVGFISFAGSIVESSPLTYERISILNLIDDSKISHTGTDIGLAIISAVEGLKSTNKSKMIILISDGHDTVGVPVSTALASSLEDHIKILTFGIGTKEGGPFLDAPDAQGLLSKLDETNLVFLSNSTNSQYFQVDHESKIQEALNVISADSKQGYKERKLTPLLVVISFILVFISWLIDNTRFRIFP